MAWADLAAITSAYSGARKEDESLEYARRLKEQEMGQADRRLQQAEQQLDFEVQKWKDTLKDSDRTRWEKLYDTFNEVLNDPAKRQFFLDDPAQYRAVLAGMTAAARVLGLPEPLQREAPAPLTPLEQLEQKARLAKPMGLSVNPRAAHWLLGGGVGQVAPSLPEPEPMSLAPAMPLGFGAPPGEPVDLSLALPKQAPAQSTDWEDFYELPPAAQIAAEKAESAAKNRRMTELRLEGNDLRRSIADAYARPGNIKTVDADTYADRQRLYEIVRYKLPLNDPSAIPDKPMPPGWGRRGAMSAYQERVLDLNELYYGLAKGRETRIGQAQSFDQAMTIWRAQVESRQFDYKQYRDMVKDAQWNAEQEYARTRVAKTRDDRMAEIRYQIGADLKEGVIDQQTANDALLSFDQPAPTSGDGGLGIPLGVIPPGGLPPMPGIAPYSGPVGLPGKPGARWGRGDLLSGAGAITIIERSQKKKKKVIPKPYNAMADKELQADLRRSAREYAGAPRNSPMRASVVAPKLRAYLEKKGFSKAQAEKTAKDLMTRYFHPEYRLMRPKD